MKLLLLFLFIPFILSGQDTTQISSIQVTSYSGKFKKMNMHGQIETMPDGRIIYNRMTAWSEDGFQKFYLRHRVYYQNGELAIDSIIDLSWKVKAKAIIIEYDSSGLIISKTKLIGRMNPNRNEIPSESEINWRISRTVVKSKSLPRSRKLIEYD